MGERRFVVGEAIRQVAGRPVLVAASATRPLEVTARQHEQIRAILDEPELARTSKQAAIDVILAGGTVDVARFASSRQPAMPGIAIGGAAPSEQATAASTRTQPRMPGISVGWGEKAKVATVPGFVARSDRWIDGVRAHANAAGSHPAMPGISIGTAAR